MKIVPIAVTLGCMRRTPYIIYLAFILSQPGEKRGIFQKDGFGQAPFLPPGRKNRDGLGKGYPFERLAFLL
jgi:hypothetical protein